MPSMCRASAAQPGRRRRGAAARPASGVDRSIAPAPPRDGRSGRSGRSSGPAPRSSPRPVAARRPTRRSRCGSGCRRGGTPRTPGASAIRSISSSRRSSCPASARSAARITAPVSIATRSRGSPRRPRPAARRRLGQRRPLGDEGAPGPPPQRDQVAALDQGRDRLAQRRAGDPKLAGEVALGGQLGPRRKQSEADRGAEPLDGLLEGGRRANRLEDGLERGVALHHAQP